jgi:basic membrane protein A
MTKKNNIGIVVAHPVPVLVQYVNAFTLGARSVNPKVKVHVVWTNSWSDPVTVNLKVPGYSPFEPRNFAG